jgi:hypothetical protein
MSTWTTEDVVVQEENPDQSYSHKIIDNMMDEVGVHDRI